MNDASRVGAFPEATPPFPTGLTELIWNFGAGRALSWCEEGPPSWFTFRQVYGYVIFDIPP